MCAAVFRVSKKTAVIAGELLLQCRLQSDIFHRTYHRTVRPSALINSVGTGSDSAGKLSSIKPFYILRLTARFECESVLLAGCYDLGVP